MQLQHILDLSTNFPSYILGGGRYGNRVFKKKIAPDEADSILQC